MRIRFPFAGGFLFLLLVSAYLGLSTVQIPSVNDKVLHVLTFFLLTLCFYWILDATRRRTLNLTLILVTFGLGIGSEILQAVLPNGRNFDAFDIAANIAGSLAALGLCTWYHKRMLERKRKAKSYSVVPQGEVGDLELGEGGASGQELGVVGTEEEAETWDEGGEAWDTEEVVGRESADGEGGLTPSSGSAGDEVPEGKA